MMGVGCPHRSTRNFSGINKDPTWGKARTYINPSTNMRYAASERHVLAFRVYNMTKTEVHQRNRDNRVFHSLTPQESVCKSHLILNYVTVNERS